MWKRYLKNERGLTLIELLAVIVILGIVAAIAIPAIGAVIENARKDAHIANARMLVDAARLYIVQNGMPDDKKLSIDELEDKGFISKDIQVPGTDEEYDTDKSFVAISGSEPNLVYKVKLVSGTVTHIGTSTDGVDIANLDRNSVKLDGTTTNDDDEDDKDDETGGTQG